MPTTQPETTPMDVSSPHTIPEESVQLPNVPTPPTRTPVRASLPRSCKMEVVPPVESEWTTVQHPSVLKAQRKATHQASLSSAKKLINSVPVTSSGPLTKRNAIPTVPPPTDCSPKPKKTSKPSASHSQGAAASPTFATDTTTSAVASATAVVVTTPAGTPTAATASPRAVPAVAKNKHTPVSATAYTSRITPFVRASKLASAPDVCLHHKLKPFGDNFTIRSTKSQSTKSAPKSERADCFIAHTLNLQRKTSAGFGSCALESVGTSANLPIRDPEELRADIANWIEQNHELLKVRYESRQCAQGDKPSDRPITTLAAHIHALRHDNEWGDEFVLLCLATRWNLEIAIVVTDANSEYVVLTERFHEIPLEGGVDVKYCTVLRRGDVVNSEHYDGTTALTAAIRNKYNAFRCPRFQVSPNLYKLTARDLMPPVAPPLDEDLYDIQLRQAISESLVGSQMMTDDTVEPPGATSPITAPNLSETQQLTPAFSCPLSSLSVNPPLQQPSTIELNLPATAIEDEHHTPPASHTPSPLPLASFIVSSTGGKESLRQHLKVTKRSRDKSAEETTVNNTSFSQELQEELEQEADEREDPLSSPHNASQSSNAAVPRQTLSTLTHASLRQSAPSARTNTSVINPQHPFLYTDGSFDKAPKKSDTSTAGFGVVVAFLPPSINVQHFDSISSAVEDAMICSEYIKGPVYQPGDHLFSASRVGNRKPPKVKLPPNRKSNNTAELSALIAAGEWSIRYFAAIADTTGITEHHHLTIAYDSEYAYGILLGSNKAKTNVPLVDRAKKVFNALFKILPRERAHPVKVVGHSACLLNDFADRLADQARSNVTFEIGPITPSVFNALSRQVDKANKKNTISPHSYPIGTSLFVDLKALFHHGIESDFSSTPQEAARPESSCAAITVTSTASKWLDFYLVGFEEVFRVDYGWIKSHTRVNPFPMLGITRIQSIKMPIHYLRNRYSSALDVVLTMVSNLSKVNTTSDNFKTTTEGVSIYKRRQDAFFDLRWDDLVADMLETLLSSRAQSSRSHKKEDLTAAWDSVDLSTDSVTPEQSRRAQGHIQDGNYRKAKDCMASPADFAPTSSDTFKKLDDKHPPRAPINEIDVNIIQQVKSAPEYTPVVITEEIVWSAIRDAPRGSSPGVDGLRNDHLYYLSSNGSHPWLKPLTDLVNLAIQGDLPEWYFKFIASANLVALSKGQSGDVRPIAMGSVWRKIISRCLLAFYKTEIATQFSLYQYGVGTTAGCEVVMARVEALLMRNPTFVLLKTDFQNAFNSIHRKAVLDAVARQFPGMLPFVASVYAPHSDLWTPISPLQRASISSSEGVQQGDVLGSFLFCLTIHPMIQELNRILREQHDITMRDVPELERPEHGELLALADDTTLCCEQTDVAFIWPLLKQKSASLGLILADRKSELYCPSGSQHIDKSIAPPGLHIAEDGVVLLGAPLGKADYCRNIWLTYLKEIERETLVVCGWNRVQSALALFRLCIVSKFNWMLRIVSPTAPYAPELISYARSILMNGLHLLLGDELVPYPTVRPDSNCWLQATLPTKMGGLGISDPSQLHAIAFMAAEVSITPSLAALSRAQGMEGLQPSAATLLCFEQCVNKSTFSTVEDMFNEPFHLQHKLSGPLHVERRLQLTNQSVALTHRLDSCSKEGAALINSLPKYSHLRIDNPDHMRERLAMRLGCDIKYIVTGDCVCNSGGDRYVDAKGYHLCSVCNAGNPGYDRNTTHNGVRNVLLELARAGGLTARIEDRGILLADSTHGTKRRMDVVIDHFEGNQSLGIDVTVVDPRGSAYSKRCTAMAAGTCASDAENEKLKDYKESFERQGHEFVPFAIESFGAFGPRTVNVFNRLIARVYAANVHMPLSFIKQYWRCRIVMAMHIGASRGMRERMNSLTKRRKGLTKAQPQPFEQVDYEGWGRTNHR
eukprot:gene28088-34890_t